MPETLQTAAWGGNRAQVRAVVDRIARTTWFQPTNVRDDVHVATTVRSWCAEFGYAQCRVHRLGSGELSGFLQNYNIVHNLLWGELKQVPDWIRTAAEDAGRTELLSYASNDVPVWVFHRAFDGAFRRFAAQGDLVVRFAVSAAMYTASLAVLWELVADVAKFGDNPLMPALELFKQGDLPLGLFEDTFYIA